MDSRCRDPYRSSWNIRRRQFDRFATIASVSPMMTLLGTIAGVALIGIPLGAFLYTILRQLFHWSPMGTGLKWSLLILWILGAVIMVINLSALGWLLPLYGLHCC